MNSLIETSSFSFCGTVLILSYIAMYVSWMVLTLLLHQVSTDSISLSLILRAALDKVSLIFAVCTRNMGVSIESFERLRISSAAEW